MKLLEHKARRFRRRKWRWRLTKLLLGRREQSHLYFSTLSRQFGTIRIGIKPEASKNIFTTTWAYNWQTILQSFDLAKSFTTRVQIFA